MKISREKLELFDKAAWLMNNAIQLAKDGTGTVIVSEVQALASEMATTALELVKEDAE